MALDLSIVPSIGQSYECQTNYFYGSKEKLPVVAIMITNEKVIGLGLDKLKDIVGPSAPLIKRFKWVCVFIWAGMYFKSISYDLLSIERKQIS